MGVSVSSSKTPSFKLVSSISNGISGDGGKGIFASIMGVNSGEGGKGIFAGEISSGVGWSSSRVRLCFGT